MYPDCSQSTSKYGRRQWSSKDETSSIASNHVHKWLSAGNVATHIAECFAKCPRNDVYTVGYAISLGNTSAVLAVQSNRVYFIYKGNGVVLVGHVAQLLHRSYVTCWDRGNRVETMAASKSTVHLPDMEWTVSKATIFGKE